MQSTGSHLPLYNRLLARPELAFAAITFILSVGIVLLNISAYGWNFSAMFFMPAEQLMALDRSLLGSNLVGIIDGGYDGSSYYLASVDPWGRLGLVQAGHHLRVLTPWLTHLLSFGNIALIPGVYLTLNVSAMTIGGYLFAKLFRKRHGEVSLIAMALFLNIGILTAFKYNLSEPMGLCLLLAGFLSEQRRKLWVAALFFAASVMARETGVLLLGLLFLHRCYRREWQSAAVPLLAFAAFLLLKIYFEWIMGFKAPMPLFSLTSIYTNAISLVDFSAPAMDLAQSLLFIPFLIYIVWIISVLWRQQPKSNSWIFALVVYFVWIGMFNPTVAWTNITGIGRHLAFALALVPLCIPDRMVAKRLAYGSLVFSGVFLVWFVMSYHHPFIIIN